MQDISVFSLFMLAGSLPCSVIPIRRETAPSNDPHFEGDGSHGCSTRWQGGGPESLTQANYPGSVTSSEKVGQAK